jgi:hypothetical protein
MHFRPLHDRVVVRDSKAEDKSDYFLAYLQREHARLDGEVRVEERRPLPDQLLVARLKKLKLAIRDQMAEHSAVGQSSRAA